MAGLADMKYYDPRLLAQVGNLELIARSVVEGMITGRHKSPFHGFSVEFSEYQKYSPGDDPKHIDWKVLAKSDRVYIKRFEAETNLRAYIVMDVSGSMRYHSAGQMPKYEYAAYCAAALSYLMVRQMDMVGLVAFDTDLKQFIAPRSSPAHLQMLLVALEKLEPQGETKISDSFHRLAERITRRGLVIVFSDFLDDPAAIVGGLSHFRHKKHEVLLFHILDPDEESFPFHDFLEFEDLETGQRVPAHGRLVGERYRKRFAEFRNELQRRCAEQGIEYAPLYTDKPIERALLEYLAKRSRLA
jgi:uncharacterized protein (DUF58 family)